MTKLNQLTRKSAYNRRGLKEFRKEMGRINRRLAWAKAHGMRLPYINDDGKMEWDC